jgi:cysteine desulfurase / selenocysteine lyase
MTLDEVRAHFPHTKRTIYLNHASTGPLSTPVVEAVNRFIEQRHFSHIENYELFLPKLEAARAGIARLLGTDSGRVEFTPNTSYGLGVLANGLPWQPGDRIAIPGGEFPANVYPFLNLQTKGVQVDFIRHRECTFTLEDIEKTLTPQTRLLSLSWVQFLSGFRADLVAIGRLCKERGIIFCVDAIQGLGALRLDVEASGIDFLASGGHKWLMGPQGTGFLYVSEAFQERISPPAGWMHGPVDWNNFFDYKLQFHEDATRFRLGTMNSMGITGLGAALDLYFEAGQAWCEEQVLARASQIAEGMERLGLSRYGAAGSPVASGIVTVRHPDPDALNAWLKDHGIMACVRNGMLRFSPTWYNTPEEIEEAVEAVAAFRPV